MVINLVRSTDVNKNTLVEVTNLLAIIPGPLTFTRLGSAIQLKDDVLRWEDIFCQCN